MARKKKPIDINAAIDKVLADPKKAAKMSVKDANWYEEKYRKILAGSRGDTKDTEVINKMKTLKTGNYSLRTQIKNHKWVKQGRPFLRGEQWMRDTVFKNPQVYRWNKKLFPTGSLVTFEYFNPLGKGTTKLPYWDKYPLDIIFSQRSKTGGLRTLGYNLHYFPPAVRIVFLAAFFEMHKKVWRYMSYFQINAEAYHVEYYKLKDKLEKKYSIGFSVKMYDVNRMKNKVVFPLADWKNAIWVQSRGYSGIKAKAMIQEWQNYAKKHGNSTQHIVQWKSKL